MSTQNRTDVIQSIATIILTAALMYHYSRHH